MRYIDSASRVLSETVHGWLRTLLPSARAFACQSGYYRFDALEPFAADVQAMLSGGGRFDLVVGANEERLSAPDLEDTLTLLGSHIPTNASFTLVGACDGLFHPKTYYVELAGGARHAAVGSANLTVPGTGHHVESCLLIDDTVDDPAVLDAVRDAILAWRFKAGAGAADARPVTSSYIRTLEAERIIDPVPLPTPASGARRGSATGQSSFPSLQKISGAPQRRPRALPPATPPVGRLPGARAPFPRDVVGVVKRLSKTDVKGFAGEIGTRHISLSPADHDQADKLPMRPYGTHGEPRLDLLIEARHFKALRDVVDSGTDPANVTHVGKGTTHGSNVDLRFNYQHGLVTRLISVAAKHNLPLPAEGDALAIEFLNGGRLARMTFVADDPLRSRLLSLLQPGRAWGWLPVGVVPVW